MTFDLGDLITDAAPLLAYVTSALSVFAAVWAAHRVVGIVRSLFGM